MKGLPLLVIGVAAFGCGSSDGDDGGEIDISGLSYSPCADESRIGGFFAELNVQFSATGGRVFDAVSPIGALETISESGACRHARAATTFCDPACGGGELCGLDNQCHPAPAAQSAGTVTVRGLAVPVEMGAVAPGFNYTNPGTLPNPAFADGAAIALDSDGGAFDSFRLLGVGVAALEVPTDKVMVESGVALALAWTPRANAGPTKISIELNVNLHGTTGSRIECVVEDTGSFTIAEPMVTTLMGDGLSGFPSVSFVRSSADKIEFPEGCVDFAVRSGRTVEVEIPGLVSCSTDVDCIEPGETCQPDLTCG